jgi:hypothetical protein
MRTRRRENRHRFRGKGAPPQRACERNGRAAYAPTLADVLKVGEHDNAAAPVTPRKLDRPLLTAWPTGYENGQFRIADGGVLLSANGQPTLFIRDHDALHPTANLAQDC